MSCTSGEYCAAFVKAILQFALLKTEFLEDISGFPPSPEDSELRTDFKMEFRLTGSYCITREINCIKSSAPF